MYLQAADYCHLSGQTDKQTDYLSQFPAPVMSVQTAATVNSVGRPSGTSIIARQAMYCTYDVTIRGVRVTKAAVEIQ